MTDNEKRLILRANGYYELAETRPDILTVKAKERAFGEALYLLWPQIRVKLMEPETGGEGRGKGSENDG